MVFETPKKIFEHPKISDGHPKMTHLTSKTIFEVRKMILQVIPMLERGSFMPIKLDQVGQGEIESTAVPISLYNTGIMGRCLVGNPVFGRRKATNDNSPAFQRRD